MMIGFIWLVSVVGLVVSLGIVAWKQIDIKVIDFMSVPFCQILKGVAICCVFLVHIGNANHIRMLAPLGG